MLTLREKFAIALKYEVDRRGRGFQARMADDLNIPRTRFNDYLKNRINCPEDLRERCAAYLGLSYEEILAKGVRLVGGGEEGRREAPVIPPDILEAIRDKRIQAVIRCLAKELKI